MLSSAQTQTKVIISSQKINNPLSPATTSAMLLRAKS